MNDLLVESGEEKIVDKESISLLKYKILKPVKAELVLMGAWREKLCKWADAGFRKTEEFADCHELMRLLAEYRIYVSDITPVIKNASENTLQEVREWLDVHGEPENYVIFCGEGYMDLNGLDDHVINTDGELDGQSAYEAVQILK